MHKYKLFLIFTAAELGALTLLIFLLPQISSTKGYEQISQRRRLAHSLNLTDLAIWTEARYTRHPALADFFSPFQDAPAAFEHFPAGSILSPRQANMRQIDERASISALRNQPKIH